MTADRLVRDLEEVLDTEPLDLARAALVIARIEYADLHVQPTLDSLDRLADRVLQQLVSTGVRAIRNQVQVLTRVLYEDAGFAGNRDRYHDFRNSLLNDVVARRLGIPISLGLVVREVGRRAGLEIFGVSFPGHFLLRVPEEAGRDSAEALILDPFDGGRILDVHACELLLRRHAGPTARFTRALLGACTGRQWLARMLTNLKRLYVDARSFPHARLATELLMTVEPAEGAELRDRGLIAYQLEDYPAALRDLEQYLRLRTWRKDDAEEHRLLTEQVKVIRDRVARLN